MDGYVVATYQLITGGDEGSPLVHHCQTPTMLPGWRIAQLSPGGSQWMAFFDEALQGFISLVSASEAHFATLAGCQQPDAVRRHVVAAVRRFRDEPAMTLSSECAACDHCLQCAIEHPDL